MNEDLVLVERWWQENDRQPHTNATLLTTNSTRTGLKMNLGLRGDSLVTSVLLLSNYVVSAMLSTLLP